MADDRATPAPTQADDRATPAPTQADDRAPPAPASLPIQLLDKLRSAVRGPVHVPGDTEFATHSKMFNGKLVCEAIVLVRALDAPDVSATIQFCTQHDLSPSIKSGGYGIAGWAIGGQLILDLSLIRSISLELPTATTTTTTTTTTTRDFTSIADMPIPHVSSSTTNEQTPVVATSTAGVKRPLEPDPPAPASAPASAPEVAEYLHEPEISGTGSAAVRLPAEALPLPRQAIRRRLDLAGSSFSPTSTYTPSAPPVPALPPTPTPTPQSVAFTRRKDPFGYLSSSPYSGPITITTPAPASLFTAFPSLLPRTTTATATETATATATAPHEHVYVTFGAGVKQKDVDVYTAAHPVPVPVGGDATLSVTVGPGAGSGPGAGAGSMAVAGAVPYHVPFAAHNGGAAVMLTGGFGFQSRLRGLGIDALVEAEVVLSDGRIVIASATSHPDLWWALRGAGPAFGVVTRYKALAYPVPVVFAGNLLYAFRPSTAPSLLKYTRDILKSAPPSLYANILLTAGPAGKGSLLVIQLCFLGPKEKGVEWVRLIESWEGEECLLNEVNEKSFLNQQDSVAQVLRARAGRQWFIRSTLITSLPDDIINETVLKFADTPVGCTWLFELAGGAVASFDDTCLPVSQREARWTVAALHQWDMGIDDPRCVTTAEDWIENTLGSVSIGGPYPSFLGRHEPASRTKACYGSNWDRLREVKRMYDPKGLFRNSFWPVDGDGEEVSPEMHEPPSPGP